MMITLVQPIEQDADHLYGWDDGDHDCEPAGELESRDDHHEQGKGQDRDPGQSRSPDTPHKVLSTQPLEPGGDDEIGGHHQAAQCDHADDKAYLVSTLAGAGQKHSQTHCKKDEKGKQGSEDSQK